MIKKGLICFIFVIFFFFSGCQPGEEEKNPFDYDLEKYQKTDTSLILYKEIKEIPVPGKKLYGIAIDKKDNIYVSREEGVVVFNKNGEKIAQKELDGIARCLAVDQDGTIYLGMENHIEVHSISSPDIKKWPDLSKNSLLTSLAVGERDVFIADAANKIVLRFDKNGKFLNFIGEKDISKGKEGLVVYQPHLDIVLGKTGTIWVVNPGKHRIENYDYEGNRLSFWGEPSFKIEGFCGCCNPSHIALLSDGKFITSEKNLLRVKVYSTEGKFSKIVAGMESFIGNTIPLDVAVDSKNRISLLDNKQNCVRIFISKE